MLGNGTANAGGLLTGAVAIGNATFADAQGFLTGAIANGLGNTAPGPFPPQTDVRSAGALSLAYGGGTNTLVRTEGILNIAAGQGDNFIVRAGGTPSDIGNVALSLGNHTPSEPGDLAAVVAGDIAPGGRNPSFFNLALNLGNDSNVQARGFANSVLNIFGNGNSLSAIGVVNNATNIFGDDNIAIAANVPTANILQRIGGNVAFTAFGNGNTVRAGSEIAPPDGPLAIAGALGVDNRTISQPGTGITIATPFNDTGIPTTVLAASSTQGNRVGLNSTGSNTNDLAASSTQGNRVRDRPQRGVQPSGDHLPGWVGYASLSARSSVTPPAAAAAAAGAPAAATATAATATAATATAATAATAAMAAAAAGAPAAAAIAAAAAAAAAATATSDDIRSRLS